MSRKLRQEVIERMKISPHKVMVISIGLNLDKYTSKSFHERGDAILHVGTRVTKNLPTTLKAFNIIAKYDPRVRLYIVGNRNTALECVEKYVRDEIRHRIIILGAIPRQELKEIYSRIKVTLIPSTYEAFSYVALESMASGTPIVASSTLPFEVIIDEFNGFIVQDPYDYKSFADRVITLLSNEDIWCKLSSNALKHVRIYDIESIAEKYITLIRKLST